MLLSLTYIFGRKKMSQDIVPLSEQTAVFDVSILAGRVSASSQRKYQEDLEAYLLFAESPEIALNPATLARWRAYLVNDTRLSPNTINRKLAGLSANSGDTANR